MPDNFLNILPEPLSERSRLLHDRERVRSGNFVLYWMRSAVRVEDNPALCAALALADQWDVPLLVYHGVDERYPWASDRMHTFILEGARDVQRQFRKLRIPYGLHVSRPGHRPAALMELGERVCAVITEEFPVSFIQRWTERVAETLPAPVVAVDTSCVVPMRLVNQAHERAFEFRRATEALREARISRESFTVQAQARGRWPAPLWPFEPVDLDTTSIAELVAQCEIDHTVGPVHDTPGGSRAARRRWDAFRNDRLERYHIERNDPLTSGVSRMSAYLHFGHISPMTLARETKVQGGEGAAKFLDELLVWRELAWSFAFHRPDHDRWSALPEWARETLVRHAQDTRQSLFDLESLARGRTGDALWDAAQRSLVVHGELHNNVRMTWGKAIAQWTASPHDALARLIELNNRYSLDGRDPNSYAGLLWCLGLFDRPFDPERDVLGRVRERTTAQHAERLDVTKWKSAQLDRPQPSPFFRRMQRRAEVVVIGAGLAGATCARVLHDHAVNVTVVDKGRGPGGRMSSRRSGFGSFDHGAQYFSVKDQRFMRYVEAWAERGVVAPYRHRTVRIEADGRLVDFPTRHPRWQGEPSMNHVVRHLLNDIEDVRYETRVRALARDEEAWTIHLQDGATLHADAVVVTTPAHQARELFDELPDVFEALHSVSYEPCLAAMIAWPERVRVGFDSAIVHDRPLAWMARQLQEDERIKGADRWVLHASHDWSRAFLELSKEEIAAALKAEALSVLSGQGWSPRAEEVYLQGHRWRYALVGEAIGEDCLFDEERLLAYCGDGCLAGKVEGAFLSGAAAAGRLLGQLS